MTSPQKENGYTPIANELLDAIYTICLNGTQFRILLVILRYTYGFSRKEHDLSETFISKAMGANKRQIQRELKVLIESKIITVSQNATFNTPRKLMLNKHYDTWCLNRQQTTKKTPLDESDTQTGDGLDTSPGDGLDTQDKQTLKQILKQNIDSIFKFWNDKKIIVHRNLTDKIKRKLSGTLDNYTIEEIKKAISNYDTILKNDKYFWTYQWTLEDFLQRGMDKFLTDSCYDNYKNKDKPQQQKPKKISNMTDRVYDANALEKQLLARSREELK